MRRRNINKKIDCSNYLTITVVNTATQISFTNKCEYCINGNADWKTLNPSESIIVPKNSFACFKAKLIPNTDSNLENWGIGKFYISNDAILSGNCMSMLFGDEAATYTSLQGYNYAFANLFVQCNITQISKNFLPATTLSDGCYLNMFYDNKKLITAPELPAASLVYECYAEMFYGCNKLNYIKMLATDISARLCLKNWVFGVASTGTFVKNPKATWDVVGINGVPSGWTVKFDGEE